MCRIRSIFFLTVLLLMNVGMVESQQFSTGLHVAPRLSFPIGSRAESYKMGIGVGLSGLLTYKPADILTLGLDIGTTFVPLNLGQSDYIADTNLTLIDAGLGLRSALPLSNRFSLMVDGRISGFAGILSGNSNSSAFGFNYSVGAGTGFLLNDRLMLTIGGEFSSYVNLYDAFTVNIGVNSRFSGLGSNVIPDANFSPPLRTPQTVPDGGFIEFYDVKLDRVFPVLYKYYDTHSLGTAVVENVGDKTIENIEIRLVLGQHMDAPKLSARIESMEPGEREQVELYALFTESVLSITEGAKLSSELRANYKVQKNTAVDSQTVTLDTYDRNAIRWDDDRKVAAFITARDEEIQRYARNTASIVRDEGLSGFSSEFQMALALFNAMNLSGCTYVVDPSSSYLEMSTDTSSVDTIQFPRQTLEYRAGDCDDLTTTYTALLESVGIETGFITIPGHIYSAFRINMNVTEAQRAFSNPEDLILMDNGQVWIPVETTALSEGFLKAWALGARQWRDNHKNSKAIIHLTREAWTVFEPVAFGVSAYELETPLRADLISGFNSELQNFINREITSKENIYLTRLNENPANPNILNKIGILYAMYGRGTEARDYFERAVKNRPYAPALINLGNLNYLSESFYKAGSYYQEALDLKPDSSSAILGLARVSHALDNIDLARKQMAHLAEVNPEIADRFAFLGDVSGELTRATSGLSSYSNVVWDEKE